MLQLHGKPVIKSNQINISSNSFNTSNNTCQNIIFKTFSRWLSVEDWQVFLKRFRIKLNPDLIHSCITISAILNV